MTEYETRWIKMAVVPKGEHLFSEYATDVEIVDEAAGEFLRVSQCRANDAGHILIDVDEWPALRNAIDIMIKECRGDK